MTDDWPTDPAYEPRAGARDLTHRDADWSGLSIVVMGLGLSGFAAADALLEREAVVTVLARDRTQVAQERATVLEMLGAHILFGAEHQQRVPDGTDLIVTSPGIPPHHPFMLDAARAGVPVWGEVELAWRMRPREGAAPWLTITGTNGKTTAVTMLESILIHSGLRAVAAGNVGLPILEAVLHPEPFDVIAVELSSFQLHWSRSISAHSSCCLNIAPDHIDWHGSFDDYRRDKGRIHQRTRVACVYNVEDEATRRIVEDAEVVEGARAIGFTLGLPAPSMVGIVDDILADRAFAPDRRHQAAELCAVQDLAQGDAPPAPHFVADALAAAALARAFDVPPVAVRDGLRAYTPQPHRAAQVAVRAGVRYVDDSKATNPPAAAASLTAHEHIVWIAGGQLKGATVDELVESVAQRLRGVVLLGVDRALIAEAVRRHAPDIPVIDIADTETEAMQHAVTAAASLAGPGDTVLLAPAAASYDMFAGYAARGDAFASAVRELPGEERP